MPQLSLCQYHLSEVSQCHSSLVLMLDDDGYLNSLLLIDFVPSTIAYYMGSRLETLLAPWNLHSLVESLLIVENWDTSMPPNQ